MAHLQRVDYWYLWILGPIYLLSLSLNIQAIHKTGLSRPQVQVQGSSDGYPYVVDILCEDQTLVPPLANPLQKGDRLHSIGDTDLHGTRQIDVMAIATELNANSSGTLPVIFERSGTLYQSQLTACRSPLPWRHLPLWVGFVLTSLAILIFSKERKAARLLFVGAVVCGIAEQRFLDNSSSLGYYLARHIDMLGSVAVGYLLAFFLRFPVEMPSSYRLSKAWIYLVVVADAVPRSLGLLPWPEVNSLGSELLAFGNAIAMLIAIGVVVHNYYRSPARGRRRARWALFGIICTALTAVFAAVIEYLGDGGPQVQQLLALAYLGRGTTPLFFAIAILSDDTFEVSGTTKLVAAVIALGGGGLLVLLTATSFLLTAVGLHDVAQLPLLAISLGAGCVLTYWAYPSLERRFVPERSSLLTGLQSNTTQAGDEQEQVLSLVQVLETLLRPATCTAFHVAGDGAIHCAFPTLDGEERLAAETSAAATLQSFASQDVQHACAIPSTDGLSVELLLYGQRQPLALLCLGEKLSHQVYGTADLALLNALAGRTSLEICLHRQARDFSNQSLRLSSFGHDLQQPVQAIRMLSEVLARNLEGHPSKSLTDGISRSVHGLEELLTNTVLKGQLQQEAIVPALQDVPIHALLEQLHLQFAVQAEAKGLDFVYEPPGDRSVSTYSDPVLLLRILSNILSNAIRYCDSGRVSLRCTIVETALEIHVIDTGRGMDEEERVGLFDSYLLNPTLSSYFAPDSHRIRPVSFPRKHCANSATLDACQ